MNKSNRPSWDDYFLAIARTVATRSPCVKRQVGAVLVSEDRAILATGYNGPPRGAPHRDETTCVRIGIPSGERADVVCCAHAEINAIAQAARHGVPVKGSTLYVTTSPCAWCARSIVNAGVVRVVRGGDYADKVAADVFRESGVPVEWGGLTGAQIQAAVDKGKADADKLRKAGWQHGLLPDRQRPAYCHGQCVNAPEGALPRLREFNVLCAGCVQEMDRATEKALTDAANDSVDPAYWRGSDDGVAGTLRAITGILDGPLTSDPSFGGAELNAVARRIIAIRTELDAVHSDLGAECETRIAAELVARTETAIAVEFSLVADERGMELDRIKTEIQRSLAAAGVPLPDEDPTAQGEIPMAVGKLDAAATLLSLRVQALEGGIPAMMAVAQMERAEAIDQAGRDARRADENADAAATARASLGSFVALIDVSCGGSGTAAPERVIEKVQSIHSELALARDSFRLTDEENNRLREEKAEARDRATGMTASRHVPANKDPVRLALAHVLGRLGGDPTPLVLNDATAEAMSDEIHALVQHLEERARDAMAAANGKLSDEIQAVRNERDEWAAKAHSSRMESDRETARADKGAADAAHNAGLVIAENRERQKLHEEIQRLEAWVEGKGSLGEGRVSKAVLKYARDHEERTWTAAERSGKAAITLDAVYAVALDASVSGNPRALAEILDLYSKHKASMKADSTIGQR